MYDSKRTRVAVSVVRLVAAGLLEDRALGLAKCTWGRGKQPNVVRHLRGSCDAKLCAPARALIWVLGSGIVRSAAIGACTEEHREEMADRH